PYSGAINTLTCVMVGAATLYFERTWTIYQGIIRDRQALAAAHKALLHLNQGLEERVEERTRALAHSEYKYRRIFEASKDMIAVTGKDGRILDLNPAGRAMLGLEGVDTGARMPSLGNFFRDDADWQRIRETIADLGFIASSEFDLNVDGSHSRRVLLSGGLAQDVEGAEEKFHFLVKDIEQQHMAREQMAQADKLASIGELSSGIAHEINNPLGIILGYTQLMLRNEDKHSDRIADLKTIEKQVRHCKSIVEDLLNFARTSAPKRELCDIHALIDDVIHFMRQHARMDEIQLSTAYDSRVMPLLLDEKKIRQVFINLLMNAQHAVGSRGAITVSTAQAVDGRKVRIRVQDSGPGIEADLLNRIFDPFFTTKPTGQGTGLGLSVSYGIIKNHGGDIWVESTPGQGAAFTIVLPVANTPTRRENHASEPVDRR
ncbi:MAG: PAS domain S-box protein, partial [Desulfatitalea sp.]|nr:PAS domain S-box protein [Desulfatitalea sp.]